jgi:DNA-binding Lrp family transcriptional regulator
MRPTTVYQHLLNDFQRDFPLTPTPYREIAASLGVDEDYVLGALQTMLNREVVSRIGPVFSPNSIGCSTLAAMSIPQARLSEIAAFVNTYREVNHNYEREHHFNLWFVVTASSEERLREVVEQIETTTGIAVMSLPLLEEFHIDLSFPLQWDDP